MIAPRFGEKEDPLARTDKDQVVIVTMMDELSFNRHSDPKNQIVQ